MFFFYFVSDSSLTAHLGGDAMLAALLADGTTQISVVQLETGFDFAGLIGSAVQAFCQQIIRK